MKAAVLGLIVDGLRSKVEAIMVGELPLRWRVEMVCLSSQIRW